MTPLIFVDLRLNICDITNSFKAFLCFHQLRIGAVRLLRVRLASLRCTLFVLKVLHVQLIYLKEYLCMTTVMVMTMTILGQTKSGVKYQFRAQTCSSKVLELPHIAGINVKMKFIKTVIGDVVAHLKPQKNYRFVIFVMYCFITTFFLLSAVSLFRCIRKHSSNGGLCRVVLWKFIDFT